MSEYRDMTIWELEQHATEIREELTRRGKPQYVSVPEGWKLVPEQPTNEMSKAGAIEIHGESGRLGAGWGFAAQVYKAMLKASPQDSGGLPK